MLGAMFKDYQYAQACEASIILRIVLVAVLRYMFTKMTSGAHLRHICGALSASRRTRRLHPPAPPAPPLLAVLYLRPRPLPRPRPPPRPPFALYASPQNVALLTTGCLFMYGARVGVFVGCTIDCFIWILTASRSTACFRSLIAMATALLTARSLASASTITTQRLSCQQR